MLVAAVMAGASGWVLAQAPQDTVAPIELPSASVRAEPPSSPRYVGSFSGVSAPALRRFGATDLTPGLNRIPGVRLETRAPGSYRVLIRGTGRRSPFGVRDVRAYWNGLLLTEAGGDTPLNFVDLANVDEVSVGKGPHATVSGHPLGGVLELSTSPGPSVSAAAQVGSFGQRAVSGVVSFGDSPTEVRLSHREGDNYRAHSALRRQTGQVSLYGRPLPSRADSAWTVSTATHVLATRLDYQLPGALTPERYDEDPRQARPGSAEAAAAIDYENVLIGTSVRARRGDWASSVTPQLSGFRFDNPFNVNHKRETNIGLGVRAQASYAPSWRTRVTLGGEFQADFRDARQYDPNGGTPGELQFSDDVTTRRLMAYAQAGGQLPDYRWRYAVGASLTQQAYTVERTYERDGAPGSATSDFAPFLAPSASVTYAGDDGLTVSALVARGSSAPTLREFRTNEGSLNTRLRPERGLTGELRGEYRVYNKLDLRLAAYYTRLSETITTFQDSSDVQLFRNSGSAHQPGLELAASWVAFRQNATALTLAPAYGFQPYRYREYAVAGESFAGRPMPGVPEHTLDVLLSFEHAWSPDARPRHALSADLNLRHESANPLNDAGTVEADAFTLLRLQTAYTHTTEHGHRLEASAGVDNLTDVRYSLGNDINPQFGNRYFQPAPGRNYFFRLAYTH